MKKSVLGSTTRQNLSYYYWMEDRCAPDFARTVEIHRKPGYDPAELFFDPALRFPKLAVIGRLLRRKLGFRTLMNVIGLDATIVKGSHGRPVEDPAMGPLIMADAPDAFATDTVDACDVKQIALAILFGDKGPAGPGPGPARAGAARREAAAVRA